MFKNAIKFTLSILTACLVLISCGEDDKGTSVSRIDISSESNVVVVGTEISFVATDQDANDITAMVAFTVNGTAIAGNTFTPSEIGSIEVAGTYEDIESFKYTVSVINDITSISLNVSKSIIKPLESDSTIITVTNQDNLDITDLVDVEVDGALLRNLNFKSETLASYTLTASYKSLVSEEVTVTAELTPSSLTVSLSEMTIKANNHDEVLIMVADQDGDYITNFASFFLNGNLLDAPVVKASTAGTSIITASYGDVESNSVSLTATAFVTRKVLIEEFTGEWCGWCPQAAYNIDLLVEESDHVLTVGIHNGDAFVYGSESPLRGKFGLDYFPSGIVGRVNLGSNVGYNGCTIDEAITDEIDNQLYSESAKVSLGINTTLTGNSLAIDVDVQFLETISSGAFLTVYLFENDVVGNAQQNYFSARSGMESCIYYDEPAVLNGFVHQYLLRASATNAFGDQIPTADATAGNKYTASTMTMDLSGYDASNCYVIAFVHPSLDSFEKQIFNAQEVKAGESIGHED